MVIIGLTDCNCSEAGSKKKNYYSYQYTFFNQATFIRKDNLPLLKVYVNIILFYY